ncbi:MAG: hypothetical protein ABGW82_10610, partial [Paracoccus sp. (in: a-proteobacteria)]
IWLAGLLYWLGTFYFIPIPHWALWIGWLVVSLYLSLYLPLFVLLSRALVHRLHWPTLIAGPLVWVGIEWLRSNVITGMAMVCLSHTQYTQPVFIQVSDLFGGYTLTFLIAMFSATLVPWTGWSRTRRTGRRCGSGDPCGSGPPRARPFACCCSVSGGAVGRPDPVAAALADRIAAAGRAGGADPAAHTGCRRLATGDAT